MESERTLVDRGAAVTVEKDGRTIFVYFRTEEVCQKFSKIYQEKWDAAKRSLDKYR